MDMLKGIGGRFENYNREDLINIIMGLGTYINQTCDIKNNICSLCIYCDLDSCIEHMCYSGILCDIIGTTDENPELLEREMNHTECTDYEYCNSNTCGNDISKCCVECELKGNCPDVCDFANRILKGEK